MVHNGGSSMPFIGPPPAQEWKHQLSISVVSPSLQNFGTRQAI